MDHVYVYATQATEEIGGGGFVPRFAVARGSDGRTVALVEDAASARTMARALADAAGVPLHVMPSAEG